MTVLVTGGCGYIGAHVVRLLQERGEKVVVADSLSTGRPDRIGDAEFVNLNVARDGAADVMAEAMKDTGATSIIHFAAHKQVGESVEKPAMYYRDNIGGLANVISALEMVGAEKLVFSSSAATYGMPTVPIVDENYDCRPINPYGETKLVGEWMVRDAATAFGLRGVSLRYFNVAGAGWEDLGDPAALNLIPIVLQRLDQGKSPIIFGDDYDTADGTCIRDYVHVLDLADAHLAALDYLDRDRREHDTFNVGTGIGSSVQEVISAIAAARGEEIRPQVAARRPGDPAQLVGSTTRIEETLGWSSSKSLQDIVDSAVKAWR